MTTSMSNQEVAQPQPQPLRLSDSVEQPANVVVVMVPYPAQGHLNQLLHLSRHILSRNIPVHFVSTATHNRQAKLRFHGELSAAAKIVFHDVPIPPYHSPPPDPTAALKFPAHLQPLFDAVRSLHAPVSDLLRSLSAEARKVVVINDGMMASVVREVVNIPNAVSFLFQSVSAFYCIFSLWEYLGKPEHVQIKKEHIPKNIPSLDDCFTPEFWASMAIEIQHLTIHSGAIYNTNRLIEGDYLDYMEILEDPGRSKKNWALGPFNPPVKDDIVKSNHFSIEWLDKQPENSVMYVSFGTMTAMAVEQIKEMAAGLKQSKQRFVWVVRDADKGDDVFSEGEEARDPLPEGFEDSVMGLGLVIRDWAPQLEILAHRATGGFISHCGWNSCMESISMGVPVGAWPMHSDQPRNAVLVTEVLKVGTVVRDWARRHEVATAVEVEEAVRKLMEGGEEVRKRAAELGRAVRESVEDGGAARLEFDSFINHVLD